MGNSSDGGLLYSTIGFDPMAGLISPYIVKTDLVGGAMCNDTLDFDYTILLPYNPMGVMWQTFDEVYTDPYGYKTIQDSSQSNDGDIVGAPTISADAKAGNSMYFGGLGTPGSVNLGNPTDLQITGDHDAVPSPAI